jgi:uncharacterized damage-inducible protein DinB
MPGLVPPIENELDGLLAYLAQQRDAFRIVVHGLDEEQLRATPTKSALSLAGLVRHVAFTERHWMTNVVGQAEGGEEDAYADSFAVGDATIGELLAEYEIVAKETEAMVGQLGLEHPVPVPRNAPWFPKDVDSWTVRWVLLHLIEETARHAGHADIIRESIDGGTLYQLMAAADGPLW